MSIEAPEGLPLEPVVPEDDRKKLWAGHITYTPHEAAVVGCRVVEIDTGGTSATLSEVINTWAEKNPDLRVINIQYPSFTTAMLLVVKRMTDEEHKELMELEDAWTAFLGQWRQKKRELEAQVEEARAGAAEETRLKSEKNEREQMRLIELGRQHEANCGKKGKKS